MSVVVDLWRTEVRSHDTTAGTGTGELAVRLQHGAGRPRQSSFRLVLVVLVEARQVRRVQVPVHYLKKTNAIN